MTEGQSDMTDNEEQPGQIPNRPMRQSELVEMKILARTTKEGLSAFFGGLAAVGIAENFEETKLRVDDVGILCDDVITFCSDELKKSNLPKRGRKK